MKITEQMDDRTKRADRIKNMLSQFTNSVAECYGGDKTYDDLVKVSNETRERLDRIIDSATKEV